MVTAAAIWSIGMPWSGEQTWKAGVGLRVGSGMEVADGARRVMVGVINGELEISPGVTDAE